MTAPENAENDVTYESPFFILKSVSDNRRWPVRELRRMFMVFVAKYKTYVDRAGLVLGGIRLEGYFRGDYWEEI